MRRVCSALSLTPVRWVNPDGKAFEFHVSVSIGVAEFEQASSIGEAFQQADKASYASKAAGKGRVCRATEVSQ